MSRRSVFQNMGTGFPVWRWMEPEVRDDQKKY